MTTGQKILIGWAVAASALVLVLLGVLIGRAGGTAAVPTQLADDGYGLSAPDTGGADAAPAAPVYTVPDIFKGLRSEWRTETDGQTFDGYAILFDPQRREVIVEQCLHRGYVSDDGSPRDISYEFCDGILWANVMNLNETGATVRDRTGKVVDLSLELRSDNEPPRLSVSFPGHDMVLIPGSKNDLMQAMENTPRMIEEKQKRFEALQAQYRKRQREQQAALRAKRPDVPTYSLPDPEPERGDN